MTLLLGDPSAPKGLSAVLGTIEVPEGASGAAPKPKLLSAAHQPINNIKPNIAHTFVSYSTTTCWCCWWCCLGGVTLR